MLRVNATSGSGGDVVTALALPPLEKGRSVREANRVGFILLLTPTPTLPLSGGGRGEAELPRQPEIAPAVGRRRDRHAVAGIFVELVAQGADRDAEDIGGMRPVAEAVFQR